MAFERFLEIAKLLAINVDVVTDNDGDADSVKQKYKDYEGTPTIFIRYDADEAFPTLEPQLLKANGRDALNKILRKSFATDIEAVNYMTLPKNKTNVALAIFETEEPIKFPEYINNAVE